MSNFYSFLLHRGVKIFFIHYLHFFFLFSIFFLFSFSSLAQSVGIFGSANLGVNNTGANGNLSSVFDISSTSRGLLIPRVTECQRTVAACAGGMLDGLGNLPAAAQGLLVYQTDGTEGFYYNTSTTTSPAWVQIASSGSSPWTRSGTNVYLTNSTDNVGIGNSSPGSKLWIQDDGQCTAVSFVATNVTGPMGFGSVRAKGTLAVPLAVQTGDQLGAFTFAGFDGTGIGPPTAAMTAAATENFTATNKGSQLHFSTTLNGTTALTPRMTIDQNGYVGIGTTGPSSQFHIYGTFDPVQMMVENTGGAFKTGYGLKTASGEWFIGQVSPSTFSIKDITTNNVRIEVDASGNVGIGTTAPAELLDVAGRLRIGALVAPAVTTDKLYNVAGNLFWNGVQLDAGSSGWSITGNAGTVDGTNFIGTTDDKPFNIRVNNQKAGRIETDSWVGNNFANTFWGYQSGNAITTGTQNTALGLQALYLNATGSFNTAIGVSALQNNTAAGNNIAVGQSALFSQNYNPGFAWNSENVAVGYEALYSNQPISTATGVYNTAIGNYSLRANTTGASNTANGYRALFNNIDGYSNTAIGVNTLQTGTSGYWNIAIGEDALKNNSTASNNVAIGNQALFLQGVYNNAGIAWPSYNVAVGHEALYSNQPTSTTDGISNTAIGNYSLRSNTTGTSNVAVGKDAGYNNIAGYDNTFLGSYAGYTSNSTLNTFVGTYSGYLNSTGADNTYIGNQSGTNNSIGSFNTFLGTFSGYNNLTGSGNVFIGRQAGRDETGSGKLYIANSATATPLIYGDFTASQLTFNGQIKITGGTPGAGKVLTSDASGLATWENPTGSTDWSITGNAGTVDGTNFIGTTDDVPFNIKVNNEKAGRIEREDGVIFGGNTFYGWKAGNSNAVNVGLSEGLYNTATGNQALLSNFTGNQNTASGYAALYSNVAGDFNTASGTYALFNTTGFENTGSGSRALYFNTSGNSNTAVGTYALYSNKAGSNATAVGYNAIFYANDQVGAFTSYNVAVGYEALRGSVTASSNTGNYNTALGYQTLLNNTSGYENTAGGNAALYNNGTGALNSAYGSTALYNNTTGNNNTGIGVKALFTNTIGSSNTAMGIFTLQNNNNGGDNTATGYGALYSNISGSWNSAYGVNALQNSTGNKNTAFGWNALITNTTGNNNTALGYQADVSSAALTNATAIGYNAKVSASNSLVLGGTGADAVNVGIGTSSPGAALQVYNATSASAIQNIGFDNPSINITRTNGAGGTLDLAITDGSPAWFTGGITSGDAIIKYGSGKSLKIGNNSAAPPQVTIDASGNMGIGETAPTNKLQVFSNNASIRYAGQMVNSATAGPGNIVGAVFGAADGANAAAITKYGGLFQAAFGAGTNYGVWGEAIGGTGTNIAGYFNAVSGANNYAIIVPSGGGNVGIGTTGPLYKLHSVTSTSGDRAIYGENNAAVAVDGYGVWGRSFNNAGYGIGGYFEGGFRGLYALGNSAAGSSTFGILGEATGSGGARYGVFGKATAVNTNVNYGLYGEALNGATANYGLWINNGETKITDGGGGVPARTANGSIAISNNGTARIFFRTNNANWYINASAGGDFSEYMSKQNKNELLEPGDVIAYNGEEEKGGITLAEKENPRILGVISETGTRNNDDAEGQRMYDSSYANVGLLGHVAVKISLEGGVIKAGDYLAVSSKKGYAMKATKSGMVIGIALEDFNGTDSTKTKAMAFINPQYWANPEEFKQNKTEIEKLKAENNSFRSDLEKIKLHLGIDIKSEK